MLKQMKLIYASGFSKAEREDWRAIIFSNINSAYKLILEAMEELGTPIGNPENEVRLLTYPRMMRSLTK